MVNYVRILICKRTPIPHSTPIEGNNSIKNETLLHNSYMLDVFVCI